MLSSWGPMLYFCQPSLWEQHRKYLHKHQWYMFYCFEPNLWKFNPVMAGVRKLSLLPVIALWSYCSLARKSLARAYKPSMSRGRWLLYQRVTNYKQGNSSSNFNCKTKNLAAAKSLIQLMSWCKQVLEKKGINSVSKIKSFKLDIILETYVSNLHRALTHTSNHANWSPHL